MSENNRRAKFYSLTTLGKKRLKSEMEEWGRVVAAMSSALGTAKA